MKYSELKAAFDLIEEKELNDEAHFRYLLLRLLFEINSNLDSLSASYRQLLKLQEKKNATK